MLNQGLARHVLPQDFDLVTEEAQRRIGLHSSAQSESVHVLPCHERIQDCLCGDGTL